MVSACLAFLPLEARGYSGMSKVGLEPCCRVGVSGCLMARAVSAGVSFSCFPPSFIHLRCSALHVV